VIAPQALHTNAAALSNAGPRTQASGCVRSSRCSRPAAQRLSRHWATQTRPEMCSPMQLNLSSAVQALPAASGGTKASLEGRRDGFRGWSPDPAAGVVGSLRWVTCWSGWLAALLRNREWLGFRFAGVATVGSGLSALASASCWLGIRLGWRPEGLDRLTAVECPEASVVLPERGSLFARLCKMVGESPRLVREAPVAHGIAAWRSR